MPEPPDPGPIIQLGLGFWGSKALLSAVELGLFTELAKAGPLTEEELRKSLDLHPRSAQDFFDALVALGMLDRKDGRYRNTPTTAAFLDRDGPGYLGGMLEMASARLYGFWGELTEGLRTGRPQNEIKHGGDAFETLFKDAAQVEAFMQAMTGLSMGANMAIAQRFAWDEYQTFVDVGGAQGGLAVQVALAHEHLTGGNFDLPVVQPFFEKYVASFGLTDRLRFQVGDFFKDPLPQTDVLVMGHVLHDWNLGQKKHLIRAAYDALPEGGALIVYEAIIDDGRRENAVGLLASLNMLIETEGGFDFTGADCQGWLREAGFGKTEVTHLAGPDSMVVGYK
ncbi:MAG: methyltransferase [Thermoplasmata archaeon]